VRTVSGPTERVVVVGAGLAGLAATLHLLGAGRQVTVVERAGGPGGAAGTLRVDGYRFDTGPTVLTLPRLIDETLSCVGERLADRVALLRLDPAYRAHFPDGTTLDVHADPEQTAAEIARVCGAAEATGYRRWVAATSRLYRAEFANFIDANLDSISDLLRPAAATLLAAGALRRLDRWTAGYLKDSRTRRLFTFQALYAGVAPTSARALYAVIPYLDTVGGVYYPRGGMQEVPNALAAAAAAHGATLRYGTAAVRVELRGTRALAVHTATGERLPADVVVLAGDLTSARRDLLGEAPRRSRMSPSAFLLLVGSPTPAPSPAQHNLHFGRAWAATFREVIREGRLMSDPSLLVGCPAAGDPSAAPPGAEAYHVLAPVPNLEAPLDWSVLTERYRDELLARLVGLGYPIAATSQVRTISPADWAAAGYHRGTPFAAAHTLAQTGPLRQPTLDRYQNVVFAGAGVQPGIGVPMVLLSGRLAAQRIVG
jgi:phytoene desaturase